MAEYGIGIVGCGMIAGFHAAAIEELGNARVTALADIDEGRAQQVAETCAGSPAIVTDWQDLVTRDDVQIVDICTPSGAHLEPAVAAAQAGKHVVIEKPLEITPARCDAVIEACAANNVKCCVIFPSRFGDAYQLLKKAIDAGRFGRLTLGTTEVKWWRDQDYYDKGGWKGTQALDGGGALMNQSIHNVDLLQWFMGEVDQIYAFTDNLAHQRIEVEDTAVAALRFKNGALGTIIGTTSVWPGLPKRIGIHGDKGSAEIDQDDLNRWQFVEETDADRAIRTQFAEQSGDKGGASDPAAIGHEGHRRQLAEFLAALDADNNPLCDGLEGRKSVEIICAIYRSAAEGRPVKLPLTD